MTIGPQLRSDWLLTLFNDLPFIGLGITAPNSKRWLHFNDHLCAMFGYTRAEMAEQNWSDLMPPEDQDMEVCERQRVLAGDADGYQLEKHFIRKDGSVFSACMDVKCLRQSDGTVAYLVASIADIGERKADEAGERARREHFALQVQLAATAALVPGLIYSLRLRPDGSMQMPYASGALVQIFGLEPSQVAADATPIFDLIDRRDLAHVRVSIDESARTVQPWRDEFRAHHSGREVWLEGHSVPQREPDGSTLWHGFIQDISARQQQQANQDAEEQRHLGQRNALIALAASSGADENLGDAFRRITQIGAETLKVARVGIWTYENDRNILQCQDLYVRDEARHCSGQTLSATLHPRYFQALATSSVIMAIDAQHDARTSEFTSDYLQPLGITSMLDVPIHFGGTAAGVLCHEQVGAPRAWTSDEQSFAVAVANLVSLAMEWSRRRSSERITLRTLERLTEAQRIGRIGDWEYDLSTREIVWSPQVYQILGRDPQLGPPRDFEECAAGHDATSAALLRARVAEVVATGETQSYEFKTSRPHGDSIYVQALAVPKKDGNGTVVALYGTVQDISARKHAEHALLSRAHQQVLVATLGRLALADTDLDHAFIAAASAVAEGLGVEYSRVALLDADDGAFQLKAGAGWETGWVGRRISEARPRSHLTFVANSAEPVIVDDFRSESRFTPSAMLESHGIISGIEVLIGEIAGSYGVLGAYARQTRKFTSDDIGFLQSIANTLSTAIERTRADQRLEYLAQHDPLTDLPNRALLTDRLNVALAQAQRSGRHLALMYMDLDKFKDINDRYGHAQGDLVLREVAIRLSHCVRSSDTVSRQGGDEFLLVLPEIESSNDATRVAQKVISSLAQPFMLEGGEVMMSGSIGIACYPENGRDAESLLRNADTAMYAAKELGRNRYQLSDAI